MKRTDAISRTLLLAVALAAAGCCATGDGEGCPTPCGEEPLKYLPARGWDFLDIFELNVGFGQGLHAAVEVTPLRFGYGTTDTHRIGLMRRAAGTWSEDRDEFWALLDFLRWQKEPCCGNGYLFASCKTHRHHRLRELTLEEPMAFYDDWGWTHRFHDWEKSWGDFGAEATLGFLALDVFVSPRELLDFVAGVFGSDAVSVDDYTPAANDYDEP